VKFSVDNNSGFGFPLGIGLGVAVTIGLAFLTWLAPNVVVRLDNTALDFQFRLRGERSPGQEVVLVLVDEKSLKEIGRWPWPRNKQALLVDQIHAGGSASISSTLSRKSPTPSVISRHGWPQHDRRNRCQTKRSDWWKHVSTH
jgi:CHASE2 domain-containing sensor protein